MKNPYTLNTEGISLEVITQCEELNLAPIVLAAWLEYSCANNDDANADFVAEAADAFEGIWPSEKAFAQHLVAETSPHPQPWFVEYLDWQGLADALFSGDYAQILLPSGEIAVFRA